jgi:hypothetical protein
VLRLDDLVGRLAPQRVFGFPTTYLIAPSLAVSGPLLAKEGLRLPEATVQLSQNTLHIAQNGNVRAAILSEFRGVDIHMNDFGVWSKSRELSCHAVVEAHTQGDQQISRRAIPLNP